jgi:hypothetical protein
MHQPEWVVWNLERETEFGAIIEHYPDSEPVGGSRVGGRLRCAGGCAPSRARGREHGGCGRSSGYAEASDHSSGQPRDLSSAGRNFPRFSGC